MHRSMRRCLQDLLYVVVLIELFLVLCILPIALINRSAAVSRIDRRKNGRVATQQSRESTNAVDKSTEVPSQMTAVNRSGIMRLRMQSLNLTSAEGGLLGCREIDSIPMNRPIGRGTTKHVFKGVFNGRHVVVKTVTDRVKDVRACKLRKGESNVSSCYSFANYKVLKEIAMLQQLRHPNVAKLLGYCIRNEATGKESVRLVMEHGRPVEVRTLDWSAKLQLALDLAELLHYLHESPMGPIRIGDFKQDQFRSINGTLKLSDLDDLTTEELPCTHPSNCFISGKDMGVPCVDSVCKDFNTVANVKVAKERFFNSILWKAPSQFRSQASKLLSAFTALSADKVNTRSLRDRIALIKKNYDDASK